jgi:anti-sigma B factor antagonist
MEASEGRADAPLAIEERRDGDEHVISLAGELDLSNADRLRDALDDAMRSGANRVVVDLSRLGFIDSTGLRILLRGEQASRADSNVLSFVRARGQVERVMRLAGIEDELTYVD